VSVVTDKITDTVSAVDQTFLLIFIIAAILFIAIAVGMMVILFRYDHKRHPQAATFKGSIPAEIIWIVFPTLIVIVMFISGWKSYLSSRNPPPGTLDVEVTGRKWSWSFTYKNGLTSDILYVPANQPVFLSMKTLDVLHGFYAPAFRIKRDLVPGMTTTLWFGTKGPGTFDVMCSQYCGVGHSSMRTAIVVLAKEEFDKWYASGKTPASVEEGRKVYTTYGCSGCHSLEGAEGVGPPLDKTYGSKIAVKTKEGEKTITADEEYLRRAILDPDVEIVKGYQAIMPSLNGKISDKELDELIKFIESLPAKEGGSFAAVSGTEEIK
jgi:cytochrome c oxidase subunit II